MTSILVTGASGFVGRYLCATLQRDNHEVFPYSLRYQQDVRDYEQLRAYVAMVQPEQIHHLAAQAYVPETSTNPARGFQVNLMGTLNLLEAVRQTGLRSQIHITGTSEEYGYETHPDLDQIDEMVVPAPTTPYGVSKLAATQLAMTYARTYGMQIVVTRAWNHTGPSQPSTYAIPSFARRIAQVELHGGTLLHGNLDARRDYMDVRDVVEAYRQAIELPPGIYNLASERVMPMDAILQLLVGMASVPIPLEVDPHLYRPGLQRGSKTFPTPNSGLFRSLTNWEPSFSLETTLQETLDYWRQIA